MDENKICEAITAIDAPNTTQNAVSRSLSKRSVINTYAAIKTISTITVNIAFLTFLLII